MNNPSIHIQETASTNILMKEMHRADDLPEGFVVTTDYQTMGKGQGSNVWESEKGKNLLFSLLLRPTHLPVGEQFLIAQLVSLGIVSALKNIVSAQLVDYASSPKFTIKWPNDIYWGNKKIGGMLIENVWQGSHIASSIVGVGLNVNQEDFLSDAPNPVSLINILGSKTSLEDLLHQVLEEIFRYYKSSVSDDIRTEYAQQLFRNKGEFPFRNEKGVFSASISGVEKDGQLLLTDTNGSVTGYYFKEVAFIV